MTDIESEVTSVSVWTFLTCQIISHPPPLREPGDLIVPPQQQHTKHEFIGIC